MIKLINYLLAICLAISLKAQQVPDMRHITGGTVIPDESYSDQPYIVKTDDGAWLCVITTGQGYEGASGQHVVTQRSLDQGKTWIDRTDVEPADGPEASYAVLLKSPSGRIFVFYNHNTDNIRYVLGDNPPYKDGQVKRVDSQGYFVFKYSDDHGRTWSKNRYTIPVREFEIDRNNVYQGNIRFFWNVGKAFEYKGTACIPLIKVGGFGEGFFTSNEGVLLQSSNLFIVNDPVKAKWITLPDGDIGLRTPPGGGPIAAEQSFTELSDGSIFCVYRTIDGYPVYTYSRDGGPHWETPRYMKYDDGRLVKHPRAANFIWKCENGKFIYWYHN
ncbi:MAG: glycoside hydrolase, partial [Prevotella sp.]|nr:glycoside hydrolase [Prevotella sp.]